MTATQSTGDLIPALIQWAGAREAIRAMLLTSTRAIPDYPIDALSDYDVILIVRDIHPFVADRAWLNDFGEVLVVYWDPIHPDPVYGIGQSGNVTQYVGGLKIDFTLWPVELLQKIIQTPTPLPELDAGYRVLMDKAHLTDNLQSPTYRAYIPTPPTNDVYQKTIEDFFSDAPYVAKCLLRGELFPVKWALDFDMKYVFLRPMLEWRAEIDHGWSIPVGALGKGLKKRLPPDIWSQLEETYAGADITENWESLFKTITLFRQVAIQVGEALGYAYPQDLDERVVAFVKSMHQGYERVAKRMGY